MLATLAKGVVGGKWYSLIDKLYPESTPRAAFAAVAANHGAAGVDHVGIEQYAENLDANLARLSHALRADTYRPQAIRRHYIPKPGSGTSPRTATAFAPVGVASRRRGALMNCRGRVMSMSSMPI
jgi:hypothetical protein